MLFLNSMTLSKTYKKVKMKYSILAAINKITHNKMPKENPISEKLPNSINIVEKSTNRN